MEKSKMQIELNNRPYSKDVIYAAVSLRVDMLLGIILWMIQLILYLTAHFIIFCSTTIEWQMRPMGFILMFREPSRRCPFAKKQLSLSQL